MPKLTLVDKDFLDQATQTIEVSAIIAAPVSDVWSAIVDNDTWPEWFEGMTRCEGTSRPASGLDASRFVAIGPFELQETFIVWEENVSWGFSVTETNLIFAKKILEQIDFEDIGSEDAPVTRITLRGAFEPHLLTKLPFPLIKRKLAKTWKTSFSNLATMLETSSAD